jgi:hypothetical protein
MAEGTHLLRRVVSQQRDLGLRSNVPIRKPNEAKLSAMLIFYSMLSGNSSGRKAYSGVMKVDEA